MLLCQPLKMSRLRKCDWIVVTLGFIILVAGVGVGIVWSRIYNNILTSNLVLTPESTSYHNWIKTPLPMYLDVYLFNWTNAVEFKNNPKLKPQLEEIGPFIFREVHERVNITWNADGTVSYNQTRKWNFVPEKSVDLNVPITNLHVIALGAAEATKYSGKLIHMILDPVLKYTSQLFVTKPAGQWLFQGMDLPLLDILNEGWIKKYLPAPIPYDKFGFFYKRNMSASYDGHFTALTGSRSLKDVGNLELWNGVNKTDFFLDQCAMVNGSSGEIFPQIDSQQEYFSLFISDVCSTLTLKFDQEITIDGVPGKQFVGDETMFDNGTKLPERSCFCEGECQASGLRNLTRCRQGAPVFVSFPHFYAADPSYVNAIDGLSPNKSLHEFRLTINPLTGIPLDVRAQIQVNFYMQPYPMYGIFKNLPKTYIPMLWFSQRAHITSALSSQASLLINLQGVGGGLCYAVAVIGVLMITVLLLVRLRKADVDQEQEPIIEDQDSS